MRASGARGTPGWRITFDGAVPADLAAALPGAHRYGRWVDRLGLWRAVGIFAVLAAIVVVVVLRTPCTARAADPRHRPNSGWAT